MDPDLPEEPKKSREMLPGAWDKDTQGEPKALTVSQSGDPPEPMEASELIPQPQARGQAPVGLSYRGKAVVVCLLIFLWVQQI